MTRPGVPLLEWFLSDGYDMINILELVHGSWRYCDAFQMCFEVSCMACLKCLTRLLFLSVLSLQHAYMRTYIHSYVRACTYETRYQISNVACFLCFVAATHDFFCVMRSNSAMDACVYLFGLCMPACFVCLRVWFDCSFYFFIVREGMDSLNTRLRVFLVHIFNLVFRWFRCLLLHTSFCGILW